VQGQELSSDLNPDLQCAILLSLYGLYRNIASEEQPSHSAPLLPEIDLAKKVLVDVAVGESFEQRVAILAVTVGVQLDRLTKNFNH